MDRKRYAGTMRMKADAPEGSVSLVFATLDVIDLDGDVTRPGAFGEQDVRLTPYGHNMGAPSIGKGAIHEDGNKAIFDGEFFLRMPDALAAFESMKGLGGLQEYSYEFDVIRSSEGEHDGQPVRFLEELKVYGVSPVYRGAGVGTETLAIKSELAFAEHGEAVAADLTEYLKRVEARAAMREKEGRTVSADDREQIEGLVIQLYDLKERLEDALKSPVNEELAALQMVFQRERARSLGVVLPEVPV